MADSTALLRMLEPAVRPVQTPASKGVAAPSAPAAGQSASRPFAALLDEAERQAPADPTAASNATQATASAGAAGEASNAADAAGAVTPNAPLSALGQLDQLDNVSLRHMIAEGRANAPSVSDGSDRQTNVV